MFFRALKGWPVRQTAEGRTDVQQNVQQDPIAVGRAAFPVVLVSAVLLSQELLGQTTPAAHSFPAGLNFPVNMRQTVAAGKTPVGTKVQAKLTVATLVGGVVVPAGRRLIRRSYRVRGEVCNGPIPPRHSHGFRAVDKWISADQGLLDGLVLPVGNARGSGVWPTGRWKQPETSDWWRLPRHEEPDFTAAIRL